MAQGERSALASAVLLALITIACGSSGDSAPGRSSQRHGPAGSGGSITEDWSTGSGGVTASATGGSASTAPPFVAFPKNGGGSATSSGGKSPEGGTATSGGRDATGGGATASAGGIPDEAAAAGSATSGSVTNGTCCADGDCLCHTAPPSELTASEGPYATATQTLGTGTLHYPTDAEPPFAGIAICPGFLNSGPEMAPWGRFYASWGFAVVVTNTGPLDLPDLRGSKLVVAIEELKKESSGSGPLAGKLAGRYGTSGYSMGGGGTTLASAKDPTYGSSVGLAAWGPDGSQVKVPTLFLCSDSDTVAGCGFSQTAYDAMGATPKMLIKIPSASHFAWFAPDAAGRGVSGGYALAFQKVFLERDERWRPLLLGPAAQGSIATNIQ